MSDTLQDRADCCCFPEMGKDVTAIRARLAEVEGLPAEIDDIADRWVGDDKTKGAIQFVSGFVKDRLAAPASAGEEARTFRLGDRVTKIKGSKWTGRVVGTYRTSLTPEGYAVESETEVGSVQIYPVAALASAGESTSRTKETYFFQAPPVTATVSITPPPTGEAQS